MTLRDLLDALWLLGERVVAAVKGTPPPPVAETKPPQGMTKNERATKAQAQADADAAQKAPGAPKRTP